MIRRLVLCMAAAGMVTGIPAMAAIDSVEAARNSAGARLRWENVKGAPYWISGPAPAASQNRGWHAVELKGTEGVALHVPPHAMLRIIADDDGPQQAPLVALSGGSGLAVEYLPIPGADKRSWLVRTDAAQASVIHLQRAAMAVTPQRVALFLGTVETPDGAALYRHEVPLEGSRVRVREASDALARRYVRMTAASEKVVTVRGPDRLLLEYRMETMPDPGTAVITLHAGLDGQPPRMIHQVTAPADNVPVLVDGTWRAASRGEQVVLDIPPGEHRLHLQSSHDVLLRASTEGAHDFLLPDVNMPDAWRDAGSDTQLEELEQSSIAAGISNQWRDIGALAAQSMQRAVLRSGAASPRAAADELDGVLTKFRDLHPADPGEAQTYSLMTQSIQSPDGMQRHHIGIPESLVSTVPVAMFHTIGGRPVRFVLPEVSHAVRLRALVPADAPPARIEIRYDNGQTATLISGMTVVDGDRVRPSGSETAIVQKDMWPPGLGGTAERAGSIAIQSKLADIEWQVPENVKSMTLRVVERTVPMALQWAGSAPYFIDDHFLANLVEGTHSSILIQDAMRPLERMTAAALAQFTAGVTPPENQAVRLNEARAREAARAALRENEPARAVELWQTAMQTADPSIQAEALRGLANSLLIAGERFTAEQLLRSHWIGGNPGLARIAEEELDALYVREGDLDMQRIFAAARAAKDQAQLARLSGLLSAEGNESMALLAGLVTSQRDVPTLLQSALRSRKWQTFDALVQQLDSTRERSYWQAQRALTLGQVDQAERHFLDSGAQEWSKALAEGKLIAAQLAGTEEARAAAIPMWLRWQEEHPGSRLWQDRAETVVRHGGGISLRSIAQDLRANWWRASSKEPLVTRVVGPARIRVEARPLHQRTDVPASGWLRVKTQDKLWLQPFYRNQPTPGLTLESHEGLPGASVVREIVLPAGVHELHIDAGEMPIAAHLQIERPALQLPVLPAPSVLHFQSHTYLVGRQDSAPACGYRTGCQMIIENGSLQAYRITTDQADWRGLPVPVAGRDPVASRLAEDDIEGALTAATEPVERMRLWLWLVERRPAERARALAHAAALAKANPGREMQMLWNQLAAGSGWSTLPLVDRSAGLRPVATTHGTPESPAGRMRTALLPPLREGEVRIGTGTRATLFTETRSAGTLIVELTPDEMPGNSALPFRADIEHNGILVDTVSLDAGKGAVKIPVPVTAGEYRVSVTLSQAYSNQFLRVRFTGARGEEPKLTRDWHIATRSQPVKATVRGPVWVRIDRLDKDGVHSDERLVAEPVSTLVLPVQEGVSESLYRIHLLRMNPEAPATPLPRPPSNNPVPVPDAPIEWRGVQAPAAQRVNFVDVDSLEGQRDSTLSARFGFQHRRDIESGSVLGEPISERFVETGLAWRRRDADLGQSRLADVFVREREHGSPVLGFRIRAEQDVRWLTVFPMPFTIAAALSGFAQNTPEKLGALLSFNASVSQTQQLISTLSHTPAIEFMARAMNLDTVRDRFLVDTDVYSPYRQRQKRALTIADTVSWRPWRDTHVAARISATTKPDLNLMDVDNHQASIQWRQLIGPVIAELGGSATRYWAAQDRRHDITRRELRLGIGRDWWMNAGNRIEVRAELRRDVDASASWGGVEVRWHWGPGRQLKDFSASELDFSALRNWHMPVSGNRIEEE